MLKGNSIIISRNVNDSWVPFAASKSCTIETGAQTIEISSATRGAWRDFIVGRKEWSVSLSFLILDGDHAKSSLLAVGTRYFMTIIVDRQQGNRIEGYALLKGCKITATRGSLVQGSFSFVGCGEVYQV